MPLDERRPWQDAERLKIGIQLVLQRIPQNGLVHGPVIFPAILAFFDGNDVCSSTIRHQQIGAIIPGQKSVQRSDTGEQADEIILKLTNLSERSGDEIMTNALLAEMDLQPVGNKDKKLASDTPLFSNL